MNKKERDMKTSATMRMALLCLALCATLCAQATISKHMRQIDHSSGLSSSTVLSIFQDRQGIMWLGTYDGLNAYDGKDIRVFRTDKKQARTLLSNVIYDVRQAPGDQLWVSTNMGVNLFSTHRHEVVGAFTQFKNHYAILSNEKGQTWGVGPNAVSYYCPAVGRFVKVNIPYSKVTQDLWFVDSEGALWLTYRNGQTVRCTLADFNAPSAQPHIEPVALSARPMLYTFAHNNILIYIDADGNLFVYNLLTRMKWYIRNVAELMQRYGRIFNILQAKDNIHISFLQGQHFALDAQHHYAETLVSSDARIFSTYYDDAQDILWMGTDCQGLRIYSSQGSMFSQMVFSEVENKVNRPVRTFITDADGTLWMGTKGDGLLRVPAVAGTYSLKNATVYYPQYKTPIAQYRRDRREFPIFKLTHSRFHNGFWIGADRKPALAFYDRASDQVLPINGTDTMQYAHTICEQDARTLWVCTGGTGLYRLRLDAAGRRVTQATRFMLKVNGDPITEYTDMMMEGDSVLWLASRGYGVIRFSLRRHTFMRYSTNDGVNTPSDDVLAMLRKGNVFWLGTNSGLTKLTLLGGPVYQMKHIGQAEGMLSDMVHGVLEDSHGILWLSTDKGLVAYNPSSHILHTYYMKNNIQVGEFCDDAYYKDTKSGQLFFGGINGMVYFTQRQGIQRTIQPHIYYQQLVVDGNECRFYDHYDQDAQTLRLSGHSVNFSLRFAILDYANSENYEYAYRLEGTDMPWTPYTEQNTITLRDIHPGTYTLCIKAKTGADDQNLCQYKLQVVVSPPWYATWWAFALYAIVLVLLGSGGARLWLSFYRQSKLVRTLQLYESSHNQHNMVDSYLHRMTAKTARLIADAARIHSLQPDSRRDDTLADICDTLLSMGVYASNEDGFLQNLKSVMPKQCVIHSKTSLRPMVADIVAALMHTDGMDIANIDIDIDSQLMVALPENALCYALNHVLGMCALNGSESHLGATLQDDDTLAIELDVPAIVADCLAQGKLLPTPPGYKHTAEGRVTLSLYQYAIDMMKATVQRTGHGLRIVIPQMPIETGSYETSHNGKPTLLLLEREQNLCCLLHDLLDDSYNVLDVHTIKEAMAALNTHHVEVFVADTLPYRDMETQFMQFVKSVRGTLMDTTFVAIFSWQGFSRLDQMLRGILDSYVIAPFGIFFLAENIRMARIRKPVPGTASGHTATLRADETLPPHTGNDTDNTATHGHDAGVTHTPSGALDIEQSQFMARFLLIIDKHLSDEDLSTNLIADEMNMSARQFYRRFKECSLLSPAVFIKNHRVERAAQLLTDTNKNIQDILFDVGFKSKAYFYKEFSVRYGCTPKEYRDNHRKDAM